MEDDKKIILTIQYDEGTTERKELLSIFKADNGRDYAALVPVDDAEKIREGADIELVRVKQYFDEDMREDYLIDGITTEAELQTAKEAFERLSAAEIDENSEGMESFPILSFMNDNGNYEEWKAVDVFEHNHRMYIAMIPLAIIGNDSNINIHLMRLKLTVDSGIEGCEVTAIPSDMEYEEVAGVFEKRVG